MIIAVLMFISAMTQQELAPAINGHSQEQLSSSVKKISESLPVGKRKKFEQAVEILLDDRIRTASSDSSHAEAKEKEVIASFDGKTADQVISEAEVIVRQIMKQEADRASHATSQAIPPAAVISAPIFSVACESILSTVIAPKRASTAELLKVRDDSFFRDEPEASSALERRRLEASSATGTDKLAVEVNGDTLSFMTRASVEAGQATGATFRVLENTNDAVFAIKLEDAVLNTIVINKRNGLAVWTKSRTSFLLDPEPDTQAHYLRCR